MRESPESIPISADQNLKPGECLAVVKFPLLNGLTQEMVEELWAGFLLVTLDDLACGVDLQELRLSPQDMSDYAKRAIARGVYRIDEDGSVTKDEPSGQQ
jgi:hypothetical protein